MNFLDFTFDIKILSQCLVHFACAFLLLDFQVLLRKNNYDFCSSPELGQFHNIVKCTLEWMCKSLQMKGYASLKRIIVIMYPLQRGDILFLSIFFFFFFFFFFFIQICPGHNLRLDFETWSMNRWVLDEVQCMTIFDLDPNLLSQGQVWKKGPNNNFGTLC